MDSKTVKLNCLTLGELKMSLFPKKKVEYPFKSKLRSICAKTISDHKRELEAAVDSNKPMETLIKMATFSLT